MATNNLDTKATSQYIQLITFKWGLLAPPMVALLASADKDITIGADTFSACPALKVDLSKQTGGVEDEPITILMPVVDPVATMLVGYPFSKCYVTIEEVDRTDTATRRKLFYGVVSMCTGNKNGNSALAEVKVAGIRSWLESPLGIPANNTCAWAFGDKNCGKVLSGIQVTRLISSIVGTTVTFSLAITADNFNRGYVTYQGLSLLIRSQTSTTVVELINAPLPSWVAQNVVLTPGCRKTVADCRKWNREINFGGFGIAIPSFHPSVETQ